MTRSKLAAPNPKIALQLHVRRHWRGIGGPERSADHIHHEYIAV
jgi:hypothetical protein